MRRPPPLVGAAVVLGSLVLLVALLLEAGEPPRVDDARRGSGGQGPDPVVEPEAWRLLERAAEAPQRTTYEGTQFVSAWASDSTTSQVLRVSHSPGGGTTWQPAGRGTHRPAAVHTSSHAADPSILGVGAVGLMARHYSLAVAGAARVAGRSADVVEARRPGQDADEVVARYWLDAETGLVLRREVYDARGRTTRASAYVEVAVRDVAEPQETAEADVGRAWAEAIDGPALRRMRAYGWDCPDRLPGPLPLVDARRGGAGKGIVHLSYADGIASISVFQQRGTLDGDKLEGYRRETVAGRTAWVRPEVPRRVVWAADDMVFTLVADAPERTVERAVSALHGGTDAGGGGPMDRLARGLDRVASWFNPFE